MMIDPKIRISDQVFVFLELQGEQWAARREVVQRMSMALSEACEIVIDHGLAKGPVTVVASFDEYNLDAEVSYEGDPLPLPNKRPSEEEILSDPSAVIRLGGYLIRGHADTVSSVASGSGAVLKIHMEH